MARHMRDNGLPRGGRIAIIIVSCLLAVSLLLTACIHSGLLDKLSSIFSPPEPNVDVAVPPTTTTTTEPLPLPDPVYRKPDVMKGVWVTPGVDYYFSDKNTGEDVKAQIDTALSYVSEGGFNTLLLPLALEDRAIYPTTLYQSVSFTDKNSVVFDPIQYILSVTREKQWFVYLVLDMHVKHGEQWDPRTEDGKTLTLSVTNELLKRYKTDGYFISGFTFSGKQVKDGERANAEKAVTDLVSAVTTDITTYDRNAYVGLLSNGVWAHKSVDERGSETAEYYEEYTDGCADTLSWLKNGLFQCVMIQNYSSTTHPTAPFQKVLSWWSKVAQETEKPFYISHAAHRIGSHLAGWKSTDQLAQQYLYCKSTDGWQGSCYDSVTALKKDTSGTAETLSRAYAGTLDEKYIYKQLTLTFPPTANYTTTNSTVLIQGGGDTNFPLTVNGKTVELSKNGFFTLSCPLSIGVNSFTFSHKGTVKTYKITYKQTLIESISPSANMTVEGGSPFVISAIARKGSTVKATFNGQTITMTGSDIKEDEGGKMPADFCEYKGTLTLPEGKVGQTTDLGSAKITATYNGFSETKTCGKVILKAKPEAPRPTVPSGSAIKPPSDSGQIVTIKSNYAETFSGGALTDDYSRPYNSYLPKDTKDYVVRTVYNGNLSYYLLASGRRVYCKDAALSSGSVLSYTELKTTNVTATGTHTVLTFDAAWCIPVYARTRGQSYYRDVTTKEPHYGLENYSQTTTSIELTFYYLSSIPTLPDVTGSPLFTSAKWVQEKDGAYTLQLALKEKGAFYGVSTIWNGSQLKISFLNPANISQNSGEEKLKGIRILLDPGHGSSNDKPWEAPFNLDYANTLKSKLEALGATVDMTRIGPLSQELSLQNRVIMSQKFGYHLVISVHMNGANGKATGATVHYYTECAYTPSKLIYDKMHAVEVTYGVGTKTNGTPRSSGTVWGTLYMTRSIFHCPSVLLECAFLDNPKDKDALVDPVYRDKLMQAVTDGVVEYFSNM